MLKVNTDRLEEASAMLTSLNGEMLRIEEGLSEIRYEFSRQPICGTEENATQCTELIYRQERKISRLAEVLHDLAVVAEAVQEEYTGCEINLTQKREISTMNVKSFFQGGVMATDKSFYSAQTVSDTITQLTEELPIRTDY